LLDNFFLLKEVSKFLEKEISGYIIKEIYTQEKDKLVITLSGKDSREIKFIEFSCSEQLPYIFLKNEYSKAKKNVLNLLPGLYEQEVLSVSILNEDRIICVNLSSELVIYFVFFKSKYNLVVVVNNKIIDSFKNKKEVVGVEVNNILLRKEIKSKSHTETVKEYFRSRYRQYGDSVYRELFMICDIDVNEKLNNEIIEKIDNGIKIIDEKLKNPEYIIYKNKSDYLPSLIKLSHLEETEKFEYGNVNELIKNYIKLFYGKTSDRDLQKNVLSKKENELKVKEKKYNSLITQLENTGNSSVNKNYGDLILANIHLIKKGDEVLELSGEEFTESIKINLKKDLSPSENAALYYEKYKKQKNSIDILKDRILKQKYEIERTKKEIENIKNNKDLKSLKTMEKEFYKENETSRFRKFKLDEKFEVWVGKDSASNDLLTTRYSSQNDLWFHVRGASGSHTVLKISDKKNPPDKKIIETAASIAAYYSKARNASNVPVAYCEKKYVKKKKGFKEGSVVMEREKVIFIKPGLPESSV
jgi:predicted ribosome quality control (RQC) complex YloA/Tae2 family protein